MITMLFHSKLQHRAWMLADGTICSVFEYVSVYFKHKCSIKTQNECLDKATRKLFVASEHWTVKRLNTSWILLWCVKLIVVFHNMQSFVAWGKLWTDMIIHRNVKKVLYSVIVYVFKVRNHQISRQKALNNNCKL